MEKKKKIRKIVKVKKYVIKQIFYDDGMMREKRLNDGFNPLELMGLLERVQIEILAQISGKMPPPTFVERKAIKDVVSAGGQEGKIENGEED